MRSFTNVSVLAEDSRVLYASTVEPSWLGGTVLRIDAPSNKADVQRDSGGHTWMRAVTLRLPDPGEDHQGVRIPRGPSGGVPPSQRATRGDGQAGTLGPSTSQWPDAFPQPAASEVSHAAIATATNLNATDYDSDDDESESGAEIRLTLRVESQLHADLQKVARQHRRSLNSEILWALEQWVAMQRGNVSPYRS
jgi:hypothetical protein